MDGLRIAAGALRAADASLSTTANNIANVNTNGFRSRSVNFVDGSGGRGVEVGSTPLNSTPGSVAFTGQKLSLAIEGDGLFSVRQNGRLAFTRDGSFTVDGGGRVVTQRGELLDPPITIPRDATGISIGKDGAVTAARADGTTTALGKIDPVRFANPEGLQSIGNNLSVPTGNSGPGTRGGNVNILQGAETTSNVDLATEMINLIRDERFTQFNAAVVRAQDEAFGTILDLKR